MRYFVVSFLGFVLSNLVVATASNPASVIFIHPDGTGLGHWNAARFFHVGPDSQLNWDQLDQLASYRVHQKNWLSTTSHAGATTHAYGKKVHFDSFGLDRTAPITSASGKSVSIMKEAANAGHRIGVVNSGHIAEPGTAVFLASSESRRNVQEIAEQVMESGADLIFCGGEIYLLPEDKIGFHGQAGIRTDGRNLIEEAKSKGYSVIFSREQLLELKPNKTKVIGIFAANDTYNDETEEKLAKLDLQTYDPQAPSFAEMVRVAIQILGSDPQTPFFLVAEEEGTDNFSNVNNAKGMLDAIGRADQAIGEAAKFIENNPNYPTLLVVAADSDAGHPALWVPREPANDYSLPTQSGSGAQLDGINGSGGVPFLSKPDAFGNTHPFAIAWATSGDFQGSTVARAHGYKSQLLKTSVDNSHLFQLFHTVLFGSSN